MRRGNSMLLVEFSLCIFQILVASNIELHVQTKTNEYKSLSGLGVFSLHGSHFEFKIKSCNSFQLTLDSNKRKTAPYYYVFWTRNENNWMSSLAKQWNHHNFPEIIASNNFVSIIDCDTFTDLWLSFDKGQILVGRGKIIGTDTFLTYNDTCSFLIQDIVISGESTWVFDTAQNSLDTTKRRKREPKEFVHFQAITCSTYKIINILAGVTPIECARLCYLNVDCYAIRFESNTKVCDHVTDIVDSWYESSYYKIMS